MGKQSRLQNRARAAAPVLPPSQTMTPEQLQEMMAKQQRQMRFAQHMQRRPAPTHWQPVMQHLATLDKVADVRNTDETLKTLSDEQIVHGLMSDNITVYKARNIVNGGLLTQYSLKEKYQRPRYPIIPNDYKLQIEIQKQMWLRRMQPLFAEGVLVNGRINIEAYFAALAEIQANDVREAQAREAAAALAGQGKDIAARIAAGELEYRHAGNVGKSVPVENLVGGFVQVETKKPEEAVLVDPEDPVATGLALERQAEVDATFEAAKLVTDIPQKWPAEQ